MEPFSRSNPVKLRSRIASMRSSHDLNHHVEDKADQDGATDPKDDIGGED